MEEKQYEVVRFINDDFELDVNVSTKENTIWLTVEDISLLFKRERSVIQKHITNIYKTKELNENITCAKNAHMGSLGKQKYEVKVYNLDMIISIGYRVNSLIGTKFRIWANNILKDFLLKGYVVNEKRTLVTNDNFLNLVNTINNIQDHQTCIDKKNRFN